MIAVGTISMKIDFQENVIRVTPLLHEALQLLYMQSCSMILLPNITVMRLIKICIYNKILNL